MQRCRSYPSYKITFDIQTLWLATVWELKRTKAAIVGLTGGFDEQAQLEDLNIVGHYMQKNPVLSDLAHLEFF